METYKIIFELNYPGAKDDIRTCYVLAESFADAQQKVERRGKKEMESVYIMSIELLEANIIV